MGAGTLEAYRTIWVGCAVVQVMALPLLRLIKPPEGGAVTQVFGGH